MTDRALIDLHRLRQSLLKVLSELEESIPQIAWESERSIVSSVIRECRPILANRLEEFSGYYTLARLKALQKLFGVQLAILSPSLGAAKSDLATALEWGQLAGQRPQKARPE